MKVQAYRCDFCGHIRPDEEITGVIPSEDMFEKIKSFPISMNNDKTNVHFCITCYNKIVIEKARIVDRKKNEREYRLKLEELSYLLKSTCVHNVVNRKKFVRLE